MPSSIWTKHLGFMESGWKFEFPAGMQVCLFRNQPRPGIVTLATLGLSKHVLAMSDGREVRQELPFVFPADAEVGRFVTSLMHVADCVLREHRALLKGDVFPDAVAELKDSTPPTVFVWLMPLLPNEAAFVHDVGRNKFESLFDLQRESIV